MKYFSPCDLMLQNAKLSNRDGLVDIAIDSGTIVACAKKLSEPSKQNIDICGRFVCPGFIESHIHLDISLMNDMDVPGRIKPFRTVNDLRDSVTRGRRSFTVGGIKNRALTAIKMALRHGVVAMRAQCHVDPEIKFKHLEALLEVKEMVSGKMDLQIVAFPQQGILGNRELFHEAIKMGADVMGCSPDLEPGSEKSSVRRKHIDAAFDLAVQMDVDLDTHVDLSLLEDPCVEDLDILYLAEKTIKEGFVGRVAAGHACGLDSIPYGKAVKVIERIAEGRLNVISQPDLYRLGRSDTIHVRRGLTRIKDLLSAGVNVSIGSNNVRDVLRPLGNFDLLEEALILAYGAHMDEVRQLEELLRMCTYNPATALNIADYGLEVGCNADLVVLDAPSPSAAIVNQAEKKYVIKHGTLLETTMRVFECYDGIQVLDSDE